MNRWIALKTVTYIFLLPVLLISVFCILNIVSTLVVATVFTLAMLCFYLWLFLKYFDNV